MRLWILSDLHIELSRGWDLPQPKDRPRFDVLVVAGDLIPRMCRGVRWLLERVSDKPVIYIAGNHEAWSGDLDRNIMKAKKAALGTLVKVLQDETIQIGDVSFAGTTLWTDFRLGGNSRQAMEVAAARMRDFRKIRINAYRERFRPTNAVARHMRSRAFLESEMRKPRYDQRLVVVTHHAPMPHRAHRKPAPAPTIQPTEDELLTAAYRSDLTDLMSPAVAADGKGALRPADLWIYGHTHESEDVRIGDTRVVSNAKGYGPAYPEQPTWANPHFDAHYVMEI